MKTLSLLVASFAGLLASPVCAQNCDKFTTDLLAGQTIDAGWVNVSNTQSHLRIAVQAEHGWLLEEVHIYAGLDPVPVNGGGNPSPGQFPYKTDYAPGVAKHVEMIPLADLLAQCGDTLFIAVHASVVQLDAQGNVIQEETAWAFGTPFSGSRWGWWFNRDLCCDNNQSGLTLDADALHLGQFADIRLNGALPGEEVYFYVNRGLIVYGSGPALNPFGGMHLDLVSPVYRLGRTLADAAGQAVIQVQVPARNDLLGDYLGLQAAIARPLGSAKSIPVHAEVLP